MNEADTHNTPDDAREELVAYLDGELDPTAVELVEKRLADDAEYRRELRQLQVAWDMLDELPKPAVCERFTQTTVEMVALSAEKELEEVKEHQQRRRPWIWAWAGAGALAIAGASYVVSTYWLSRPNQALLRDLPVIEDIDLYKVADSIEFLEQMDRKGLFAEKGLFDEETGNAP